MEGGWPEIQIRLANKSNYSLVLGPKSQDVVRLSRVGPYCSISSSSVRIREGRVKLNEHKSFTRGRQILLEMKTAGLAMG